MIKNRPIEYFAYLAIAAAFLTIGLKSAAYVVTGSVGLLSDAIESLVNLATAFITLFAIKLAKEPEDERHQFGHSKVEYFSSLTESLFIFIAAISIILTAVERIFHPTAIQDMSLGIIISLFASAINGLVAWQMFKGSKEYNSIALKADAHHLLTDVYTSIGVIIGVILVYFTGWLILDPIIAILVGLNILKTAFNLAQKSFHGLIDESLDEQEIKELKDFIVNFLQQALNQNAVLFSMKSRVSGHKKFVYLDIGLPDYWDLKTAHALTIDLENEFKKHHPDVTPFIHIEAESDFDHS